MRRWPGYADGETWFKDHTPLEVAFLRNADTVEGEQEACGDVVAEEAPRAEAPATLFTEDAQ